MPQTFSFSHAEMLLRQGCLLTRPELRGRFVLMQNGRLRIGSYIGETSLGSTAPYVFTAADKAAVDWRIFTHDKPDAWEGCDAG